MPKFKLKTIHLEAKGIKKVLGDLESLVMEVVWQAGPLTVRQVRDLLAKKKKDRSFNSIMTIMNRLVGKGLLQKKEDDAVFLYSPSISKKDFSTTVTKDIFTSLLRDPSFFGASGFAELASDLDKETLNKLKRLVK